MSTREETTAPIFLIADDDREALDRLLGMLPSEWFFIPVSSPRQVVGYARRVGVAGVFLADPIDYPRGGAAHLLQKLLDAVRVPVVILAEKWEPALVERWKAMGAADCIPHPTRTGVRIDALRKAVQALALQNIAVGRIGTRGH